MHSGNTNAYDIDARYYLVTVVKKGGGTSCLIFHVMVS